MSDAPAEQPASEPPESTRGPVGRPRGVGITIFLAIITLGIWTYFWSYWSGNDLKKYRGEGVGGGVFLVLTIVLAPITMFLMANEVEKMYTEEGEEPRITTIWGLWFLLPLIGNIIWFVRIQNAMTEFWVARGAAPNSGPT